ncbi:MAG: M1 family aminopeptidase, partial [Promethearchaeota archaeon]
LSSKINQTVYECIATDTDFYYVAYQKAPLIFEKLRQTIGISAFLDGLKVYFERHQFELVLLSDIQQAFEDVIGQSLDWFFFPWFDNLYLPNYSITGNKYSSETQNLTITVVDQNEAWNDFEYSQQVPLNVYDASNSLIFSQTVWINGTTELSFTLSSKPHRVSLVYNNYVLVQIADEFDLTLDSLVQNDDQAIPGYEMAFFLMISLILIGFVIVAHRRKLKSNI